MLKSFIFFGFALVVTIHITAQVSPIYEFSDFQPAAYSMPKQFTQVSLSAPLISPTEGADIVWDFTSYQATSPLTIQYYKVRDSLFHGSNILDDDNNDYIKGTFIPYDLYYRFDSTGNAIAGRHYFHLGMDLAFISGTAGDSLVIPDQAVEYMPSFYSLRFPQTYPDQFTSTTQYEMLGNITFSLAGYNHTPFTKQTIEKRTETIAGWGNAIVPLPTGGSASFPCILQKSKTFSVDSFFVNGQPAPIQLLAAFGMSQGATTTSSSSYLYSQGAYMPLITYLHTDDNFGPVGAIYMTYHDLGYASITEENISSSIQVYPNPSTESIIHFDSKNGIEKIDLLNIAGKIIFSIKNMENKNEIIIPENISNGIYFLNITSAGRTITKKWILNK